MVELKLKELIQQKTCLAIMGPTACGKSRLSMALNGMFGEGSGEQLPIEIISVDSALIYKGMDIGTAKPTKAEMAEIPHHLINIIEPTESYSVAEFVEDAHRLVVEIFSRNRLPVFVGGTMMYFNALQKGLASLPSSNPENREKLFQQWQQNPQAIHQRLAEIDPEAAKRIHYNDSQRVVRALDVYQASGKSMTQLQQEATDSSLKDFKLKKVALIPEDRAEIHKNIEIRFKQMLEEGFLKEVSELMKNEQLHEDLASIRSVGYRQAWSYLKGDYDYDTFVEKGIIATRQLAKRQITWLRKEQAILKIDSYQKTLPQQVEAIKALLSD